MRKNLLVNTCGRALFTVFIVSAVAIQWYAQTGSRGETCRSSIRLVDPYRELTQLELFRVDELFEIAEGKGAFPRDDTGLWLKEDFLYRVWGRTRRNAIIHLGAQFPYASLIPRYREFYARSEMERIPYGWYPLTTIDSKEALETFLEELYRPKKHNGIAWWFVATMLNSATYGEGNDKYDALAPGNQKPMEWWNKVKDKWPGHLLYRALEDALVVLVDKSRAAEERERAGEFVANVAKQLPLAALLPYVEPIARDKSESSALRRWAIATIGRLKVNDAVPVLIDLLTDLTGEDPHYAPLVTVADVAYSWLRAKTGVSSCYELAFHADGTPRDLGYLDAKDLPLTLREIIALDLCPVGYCTPSGGILRRRVVRMSELSELERLKLQQNWRYFWEKMKDWILVQ